MSCLTGIANAFEKFWHRNKFKILTSAGITGIIVTPILSGIATYNAIQIVEEEKKKREVEELEPREIVQLTWKCYIPTGICVFLTAGTFLKSNSDNTEEKSNLLTAYLLSESRLKKEREKVALKIGDEEEEEIHHKVLKEQESVEEHPAPRLGKYSPEFSDLPDPFDKYPTLDSITGQKFMCNSNIVETVANELNKEFIDQKTDEISYTDFLQGCGGRTCAISEELGWSSNGALIDPITYFEKDKYGRPYLIITHKRGHEPYRGYDS